MTQTTDDLWASTFRAQERGAEPGSNASDHNILVVSDLHLGENLASGSLAALRQIARVSQAFTRFLAYYADHRPEGRPWRLIIAGDMIDFVRARVVAEADVSEGDGAARAAKALDRVIAAHDTPFRDLTAFVERGHEVVILKGNHDAELHWDEVQVQLVERLAGFATHDPDGVRARVTVSRWFWTDGDLVYVEHGNQYDRFCSFDHVLEPTLTGARELEEPIAHSAFHAFAQLILGTMDIHAIDRWTIPDFAKWLAGLGPKVIAKLAYTYFATLSWMVATRRRLGEAAVRARATHRTRFAELARRSRLSEDVLDKLDALRERPAGLRLLDGIRMLYMDRVFVAVGALLALAALLLVPFDLTAKLGSIGGLFTLTAVALAVLAYYRDVSTSPKLKRVAGRIKALVKVRYVVLGHSHVPAVEPLDNGGTYFNTGSWSGDANGGMTHLCITRGADGSAELRRWDPAADKPFSHR